LLQVILSLLAIVGKKDGAIAGYHSETCRLPDFGRQIHTYSDVSVSRRNTYIISEYNYRMDHSDFQSIGDSQVGKVQVIPILNELSIREDVRRNTE
jgi:hypothetical protein